MDSTSVDFAQLAYDRLEIADAVYRYAFGLDHGDAESLASAFTEDCVVDFSRGGAKLGLQFPVLNSREAVIETLIPMLGPLDTSHTASNFQIEIRGERATLRCYMMSQHFMPGDGPRQGTENALLMNRYDAELVRDERKWRFKRLVIDNAWAEGDPGILTALATHRVARTKLKHRT